MSDLKTVVIMIRSPINSDQSIRETFKRLSLSRRLHCRVFDSDPTTLGMINKVKDYVTWGQCSLNQILEIFPQNMFENLKFNEEGVLKSMIIRLHPPRKGFKGIRRHYDYDTEQGTLGNRRDKIVELLKRMVPMTSGECLQEISSSSSSEQNMENQDAK